MKRAAAKLVAFDLGGVVVDVDKNVLAALGPVELVARAFFAANIHDDLTTGAVDGDGFIAGAADILGADVEVVRHTWASMVRFSDGGLSLIADCAARGPVAIWSNTDPIHWAVLAPSFSPLALDLAPSFLLGAMKPERAYFAAAVARLAGHGYVTADIVFVDDRADNVAAAIACGIDAVIVDGVAGARAALVARAII